MKTIAVDRNNQFKIKSESATNGGVMPQETGKNKCDANHQIKIHVLSNSKKRRQDGDKKLPCSKPWLGSNGNPKSDIVLKEECKTWTPNVWEEYLETLEVDLKEAYLEKPESINNFSESEIRGFFQDVLTKQEDLKRFPLLQELLHSSLSALSPRESQVLRLRYWEMFNQTETAEALGLSRSSVRTLENRSLKKIKEIVHQEFSKRGDEIRNSLVILRKDKPLSPLCHRFFL